EAGEPAAVLVQGDVLAPGPGRQHLAGHAEVVEDLQRSRLQALAAGLAERLGRRLDDERIYAAPGEVDGQGQPGGTGSRDEDVGVHGRSDPGAKVAAAPRKAVAKASAAAERSASPLGRRSAKATWR